MSAASICDMNTNTVDEFIDQALRLPIDQRSRLVGRLIESLESDDLSATSTEWKNELGRRGQEIDGGTVKLIPHDQAIQQVQASLSQVHTKA